MWEAELEEPTSVGERRPEPARPSRRRRVLLGIRDLVFHQEVLDYLERDPRVEVVAAVTWPGALIQATGGLELDATVACPAMVRELRHPAVAPSSNLMVVAEEMTVPVLKEAIEAGARGVFAWPEERGELVEDLVRRLRAESGEDASPRGRVIAVYGARGGSGTTFVATQLAASFADAGRSCVLVDVDATFADISIALGIDGQARTIEALQPVAAELAPDHVEDVLFRHPRGFAVLPAPGESDMIEFQASRLYPAAIALLAGSVEVVVAHIPREVHGSTRAVLAMADQVLLVVAPDVFSLHAARRAILALNLDAKPDRCRVILNPAVRHEIGRTEIERVLGMPLYWSVRFDPSVPRAQARSRLFSPRAGRAAKDLRLLAKKLLADRLEPVAGLSSADGSES